MDTGFNNYTSRSEIKRPIKLLKEMLNDLIASKELAGALLRRDINAKYRQSVLGILWAILPAIFTSFAFTLANNSNTISFQETSIPYPAFVIFNMVIWQTFVEAINGPLQTISESKVMLAKINFKREALILSKFGEVWFNFFIKLILLIIVFFYFKISIQWTALFSVFPLIILILFGLLIGIFLSPFSLIYKDITYGIGVFTNFFLFITPVIFPKPTQGDFAIIVNSNPLTHIIESIRALVLGADSFNFGPFLITSAIILFVFFFSWLIFRLAMPYAIERIAS